MGEVYRALDLRLGLDVALKVLPAAYQRDPERRDQLRQELALARRIAHPNVCRVHDLGEADGLHFFTMEYVDGETLASLLQRLGALPRAKALEIAWQLCSGLEAIHAQGILHRDLKPSNLLLDQHGQVRITDFGIAIPTDSDAAQGVAGTPRYMAPEQLGGGEHTERTDLYCLGLVLYELFTGRPVFASAGARLRAGGPPLDPGELVAGLDPEISHALLSCLQDDPSRRPATAAALRADLTGVDPLRLTPGGSLPSPRAVAGYPQADALGRPLLALLLATVVAGVLALAALSDATMLFRQAGLDDPPEVLADRGRALLAELGYTVPPADTSHGFLERLPAGGLGPEVIFWYRESAVPLIPADPLGRVRPWDPEPHRPGTRLLALTPHGSLLELWAVPDTPNPGDPISPLTLLAAAGLPGETFTALGPEGAADSWSWSGDGAQRGLEMAYEQGRPVRFRRGQAETTATLLHPPDGDRSSRPLYRLVVVLVIGGCAWEARRTIRAGHGDRTGARRLGLYVLAITLLGWLLGGHHTFGLQAEGRGLEQALGHGLYLAILLCWLPYLALEPKIRRRWPRSIISWTRLLAGRWRDPRVGRDVLLGLAVACALQLVLRAYQLLPWGWSGPTPPAETIWPDTLLGPGQYLAELLRFQGSAIFFGFALAFLVLVARAGLRSEALALITVTGLLTSLWFGEVAATYPGLSLAVTAVRIAGFVLLLRQAGVLAAIVAIYADGLLNTFPVTLDLGAWYAESSILVMVLLIAAATWAFRTCAPAVNGESGRATVG